MLELQLEDGRRGLGAVASFGKTVGVFRTYLPTVVAKPCKDFAS